MHSRLIRLRRHGRRAGVVVQVAVMSTLMMGMAALAIDIGSLYAARAELQSAADSSALAAAANLAGDGTRDPKDLAREAADEYARRNKVAGKYAGVNSSNDVEFGRAIYDSTTKKFAFSAGGTNCDAVRITLRREDGSEGGPIPLTFANVFGHSKKGVQAHATAVLIPRDIAVVIDLSGSMNDDSELKHYKRYQGERGTWRDGIYVNLRDNWCALNGPEADHPYVPGKESETQYAGDTGPSFGLMDTWGTEVVPESYDPASDSGLLYLPKSSNWSITKVTNSLTSRGYSADERTILTSGSRDGTSNVWLNRAGVCLGLADWKSGRPGGKSGGDGDSYVENSEVTWISYPSWRSSWKWSDYINWVATNNESSSDMYAVNHAFRYRYGVKTFVNYLLEIQPYNNKVSVFWQTPEQPLRAVKDAVQSLVDTVVGLDGLDQMSLEIFATTARHEVNLSENLQGVADKLYSMQAAHYDGSTNIGGGLLTGIAELESSRVRKSAAKVIVLMSDGKPNINENGSYQEGDSTDNWVKECAQEAADKGMRIYTISVGSDADTAIMEAIAAIGKGQHFHAEGTPEEYSDQLDMIFRALGGKRPVALIE